MQKCIFTSLDSGYVIAWLPFIRSLKKYNGEDIEFVILDTGLKNEDRILIEKSYSNLRFIKPMTQNYHKVDFSKTKEKLKKTLEERFAGHKELRVRVVILPENSDPDSFIRDNGIQTFKE